MQPIIQHKQYSAASTPTVEMKGGFVFNGVLVVPITDGEPVGFPEWFSSISRKACAIKIDPIAKILWGYDGTDWFQITGAVSAVEESKSDYGLVGLQDGTNATFATTEAYKSGTLKLSVNGVRQFLNDDYEEHIDGTFTFTIAPEADSKLIADYIKL